ncbi:MAG TPA: multiheme c-type cytochrome [Polyangiaceae bacterium]|nr:multiheme c-type cytochrome [Polyangiaceae bacterium]
MTALELARRRRLLERGLPWLVCGLALAGAAIAASALIDLGILSEYQLFPSIVRGYTPSGAAFGVLAVLFTLGTLFYSLRRRSLQETLPIGRGTLAMWLWSHVTLGGLALVFACVHAGYGAFSLQPSFGKALLALLFVVSASGAFWRLVYGFVPRRAARTLGNYAADESLSRARAQAVEIDKLAAGRSPRLRALVDRVLAVPIDAAEAGRSTAALDPSEAAVFADIARLASERHAALARARGQERALSRLQGPRVWHVPVSLLFALLVPLHVFSAYDVPERLFAKTPSTAALAFEPSTTCSRCHAQIVKEWQSSMHAHALDGPLMRAQTNVAARTSLASASGPDPKLICVNCHGPVARLLSPSPTLPLAAPALAAPEQVHEGITCVACHAQRAEPRTGGAGLSAFAASLAPGRTYFGPRDDAVGNAFHRSERSAHFEAPERLCQNCHSVVYDLDGDGRIEKGKDLVLQDLFSEWQAYRAAGGASCIDCHMPPTAPGRSAERADVPFEQDGDAPPRARRSHRFVGPDYPLDRPAVRDETRAERHALLASAAKLALSELGSTPEALRFVLTLSNTGAGHGLPGGFAFVRQMWLEVSVFDAQNRLLASSGRLRSVTDDLCDAELLQPGRALARFASGCSEPDRLLVNLQQRLVERIEVDKDASGNARRDARGQAVLAAAANADEVVVQHVTSGAVARLRPFDGQRMPPLDPGSARQFAYTFVLPAGVRAARIEARLLFRAVPPYFLRALANQQSSGDGARLDTWLGNLEIVEMTRVSRNATD